MQVEHNYISSNPWHQEKQLPRLMSDDDLGAAGERWLVGQ